MDIVKLNPRTVENELTGAIELQGTARIISMGNKVQSYTNSEGEEKNYRIATVGYSSNGQSEVQSAQVSEKTYTGEDAVKQGDLVSINISADDNNTYFRVIGTGGGSGIQSKDVFAGLLANASKASTTPTTPADAAPAGQQV